MSADEIIAKQLAKAAFGWMGIIEHMHGVHKRVNQAFLKLTVCGIAMTELIKPCYHLFAGQLWLSLRPRQIKSPLQQERASY